MLETYSTTQNLTKDKPNLKKNNQDQFESCLFLPQGPNRIAEGGLRTQDWFKKNLENKPLMTVITVVFNGKEYLEETILSVINQTYDNIEYIVIDGGSTDGTLDIIKKYEHAIDYWVSESDKGIYDAWNKAVQVSMGMWICFLGADDCWADDNSVKQYVNVILCSCLNGNFISSLLKLIDKNDQQVRQIGSRMSQTSLIKKFNIAHPGAMHHRSLFEKHGLFDIRFKSSADYDFLLRSSSDIVPLFMNKVTILMREGGVSNTNSFKAFKVIARETFRIQKKYSKVYAYKNYYLSIIYFFIDHRFKFKNLRHRLFGLIK